MNISISALFFEENELSSFITHMSPPLSALAALAEVHDAQDERVACLGLAPRLVAIPSDAVSLQAALFEPDTALWGVN